MTYEIAESGRIDEALCRRLDAADPLAVWRSEFVLPDGIIYLDGNSLGPLPKVAAARINKVVNEEWGRGLIRSWNDAAWIDAPRRLGAKIAPLLGVDADEVVVADSTSVNLFKLLIAAMRLRPDRKIILTESGNFPTDVYVARGVERLLERGQVKEVPGQSLIDAVDEAVAVVLLTHVDYRTSRMRDLKAAAQRAHEHGGLVLADLSHSTGAVPLELHDCNLDLAVGCGYKYLNGGPGAPAFMYVARRHQSALDQPIPAWMGHVRPFEFSVEYTPAEGVSRLLSGTPPILSMATLEAALDIWKQVDLSLVRAKSEAMSELFIRVLESQLDGSSVRLASPRQVAMRGSHVSLRHPEGYAVVQALVDRNIIGDFRAPDLMRFGFAPLYLTFADVWRATTTLVQVIKNRSWDQPRFHQRRAVT